MTVLPLGCCRWSNGWLAGSRVGVKGDQQDPGGTTLLPCTLSGTMMEKCCRWQLVLVPGDLLWSSPCWGGTALKGGFWNGVKTVRCSDSFYTFNSLCLLWCIRLLSVVLSVMQRALMTCEGWSRVTYSYLTLTWISPKTCTIVMCLCFLESASLCVSFHEKWFGQPHPSWAVIIPSCIFKTFDAFLGKACFERALSVGSSRSFGYSLISSRIWRAEPLCNLINN